MLQMISSIDGQKHSKHTVHNTNKSPTLFLRIAFPSAPIACALNNTAPCLASVAVFANVAATS